MTSNPRGFYGLSWLLFIFASICGAALLVGCNIEAEGAVSFETDTGGREPLPPRPPDLGLEEYEPPFKLDLPEAQGCDQLDVLFVVDNSGSMLDKQQQLIGAVPGFIEQLQRLGLGFDMHIGVVTTDSYDANAPGCRTLGALVTQNLDEECSFGSGERFMSPEDLQAGAFECAFNVGTAGHATEQPILALRRALMPSSNGDGSPFGVRYDECNEGFRREGAAFVAVILTDEDAQSPDSLDRWLEELDYLLGDVTQLYVGFVAMGECGHNPSTRLLEFFDAVPAHVSSVCADYSAEFEVATRTLADSCAVAVPQL